MWILRRRRRSQPPHPYATGSADEHRISRSMLRPRYPLQASYGSARIGLYGAISSKATEMYTSSPPLCQTACPVHVLLLSLYALCSSAVPGGRLETPPPPPPSPCTRARVAGVTTWLRLAAGTRARSCRSWRRLAAACSYAPNQSIVTHTAHSCRSPLLLAFLLPPIFGWLVPSSSLATDSYFGYPSDTL